MGTFIWVLAASILSTLVLAWGLMILVGVVHGLWIAALPTIGFAAACALIFMFEVLALTVSGGILAIQAALS